MLEGPDGLGYQIDFLQPGTCDCATAQCYRGPNNLGLSPQSIIAAGVEWTNRTPGTVRFTPDIPSAAVGGASGFYIQYPRLINTGTGTAYVGYRNVVDEPTIVRLIGAVGGDIQINIRALGEPQTWDSSLNMTNFVPQEGEFPCGRLDSCPIPRNGPHNLDFVFALYPNMFFYLEPFSYIRCFPYLNLRLRRVGPYTAP